MAIDFNDGKDRPITTDVDMRLASAALSEAYTALNTLYWAFGRLEGDVVARGTLDDMLVQVSEIMGDLTAFGRKASIPEPDPWE
jgi:hypothetical protein